MNDDNEGRDNIDDEEGEVFRRRQMQRDNNNIQRWCNVLTDEARDLLKKGFKTLELTQSKDGPNPRNPEFMLTSFSWPQVGIIIAFIYLALVQVITFCVTVLSYRNFTGEKDRSDLDTFSSLFITAVIMILLSRLQFMHISGLVVVVVMVFLICIAAYIEFLLPAIFTHEISVHNPDWMSCVQWNNVSSTPIHLNVSDIPDSAVFLTRKGYDINEIKFRVEMAKECAVQEIWKNPGYHCYCYDVYGQECFEGGGHEYCSIYAELPSKFYSSYCLVYVAFSMLTTMFVFFVHDAYKRMTTPPGGYEVVNEGNIEMNRNTQTLKK